MFFLSYIFGAICGSFRFLFYESIHCLLQGELLFICPFLWVSILSLARDVFVRTEGNVSPPLWRGLIYIFSAFALFFTGVATLVKNRLGYMYEVQWVSLLVRL